MERRDFVKMLASLPLIGGALTEISRTTGRHDLRRHDDSGSNTFKLPDDHGSVGALRFILSGCVLVRHPNCNHNPPCGYKRIVSRYTMYSSSLGNQWDGIHFKHEVIEINSDWFSHKEIKRVLKTYIDEGDNAWNHLYGLRAKEWDEKLCVTTS